MTTPERFQVDLGGVVDLLGRSLYSSPRVYLRELIQNAADAVGARAEREPGFSGTVRIVPADVGDRVLSVTDDGIGLTAREARELLATVGRTSKRDLLDLPRSDRLGRFGVGLLSAFMIADEVEVRSRSLVDAAPCVWVGRSDGTFTVRELEGPEADQVPVGSTVLVRPRGDDRTLAETPVVLTAAGRFAEHLPVPVRVVLSDGSEEQVTVRAGFLGDVEERLAYGHELVGQAPLAAIPIDVPETGTRGTAYVLPFTPAPGATVAVKAHLGGMLVGTHVDGLLPDWAFFTALAVDSTGLTPTAAREALVDDDALVLTREAIGHTLRGWVEGLAVSDPMLLRVFAAVHGLALRRLALADPELAHVVIPHLVVPTTAGDVRLGDLIAEGTVRYAATVDEFRQAGPLARGVLVNAGHTYDEAMMRLLASLGLARVERVDVIELVDALRPAPPEDAEAAATLARRATAALDDREGVSVDVRLVPEGTLPAIFVQDASMLRAADRRRARDDGDALWARVLDAVEDAERRDGAGSPQARLVLDWSNPTVKALARLQDESVLTRAVGLLLVTALLAGHHPVEGRDRAQLTDALGELVALSVGLAGFGEMRPEDFA
ncbi:HSP90 family protein [Demequina zhanjiangensis]|uniref:HSP90 family protein n=1 Tax=Demequina zhanjiangensis TaxID=3051659 RepID=A0ABT8G4P0_9MICO|nr:HSP90 family protein [Demequina sp. SYSU T00b26]MDN4473889.1 HSP90 family protein [Demequina sp. SYSU T00b26]